MITAAICRVYPQAESRYGESGSKALLFTLSYINLHFYNIQLKQAISDSETDNFQLNKS